MVYAYLEDVEPFFRHRKNTCIHLCYIAALSFQRHFDFLMQKYIFYIQADFYNASSFCSCFGTTANHSCRILTKRFGGTCIKNRRMNSSPGTVFSFH